MRVLWFSLSPCGSVRRNNQEHIIQGWMISLEDEIKKHKEVDLSVAFFSETKEDPFTYDGVKYYPMYIPKSKNPFLRIYERRRTEGDIDKKLLPRMLAVVKDSKPDLIHIHGTEERFGMVADLINNIPIAFSIQGLIAPYCQKYFSGMQKSDVERYEGLSVKLRNVGLNNELKSFEYKGKREVGYLCKAQHVFGRTFWDKDITGLLNPNRNYYVVNEIMRAPFYVKEWNKTSFSKKIRLVSTISGGIYKGYETLLRAAKLLKEHAMFDFEWCVAGYGKDNAWAKIGSKITKIDPNDCNVNLMGRIGAEDLAELLVSADIYCHVSHIENSPNSVCEAMLVGMPVIASFAGGTSSLLSNGEDGILVQDGDPYELAGAIVQMQSHFEKAKKYGESGRKKALIRHNPQRIADELLIAYNTIIKQESV